MEGTTTVREGVLLQSQKSSIEIGIPERYAVCAGKGPSHINLHKVEKGGGGRERKWQETGESCRKLYNKEIHIQCYCLDQSVLQMKMGNGE